MEFRSSGKAASLGADWEREAGLGQPVRRLRTLASQRAGRLRLILGRLNVSTSAQEMNLPGLDPHELRAIPKDTQAARVAATSGMSSPVLLAYSATCTTGEAGFGATANPIVEMLDILARSLEGIAAAIATGRPPAQTRHPDRSGLGSNWGHSSMSLRAAQLNFAWFALRLLLGGAAIAPLCCLSQTPQRQGIEIYSTALIEAAKELQEPWGYIEGNPLYGQTQAGYRHLLVCRDQSVRADYPASDGERRFEYLTSAVLLSRRKKAKKDFPVLVVYPATVEKTRIEVVVHEQWIGVRRGSLIFQISGWAKVYFRLDRERGEFVFDEVKLGGI